ncbi:uncharacterized protein V1518DRAFT_409699 [Limtongia smithiae]|uniref:uncharacterized protein n=1 Tax=Limtongia smithiae TaxID=1125753 RepID=UPI0034CDE653
MVKPRLDYGDAKVSAHSARVPSGAFTQISQAQIHQIKQSFTMLDNDRDGIISRTDLQNMLTSLRQQPDPQTIDKMMTQIPGPIQFPVYLTAMSSILSRFSSKEDLVNAFSAFDNDDNGQADAQELREALIENGVSATAIDACFKPYLKFSLGKVTLLYKDLVEGIIV